MAENECLHQGIDLLPTLHTLKKGESCAHISSSRRPPNLFKVWEILALNDDVSW